MLSIFMLSCNIYVIKHILYVCIDIFIFKYIISLPLCVCVCVYIYIYIYIYTHTVIYSIYIT